MIDQQGALGHPVRVALVELLHERGTVTSTEAARELGGSSGLHSFHLRQLARYGLIEEVPGDGGGRAKPWRLASPRTMEDALQSDLDRDLDRDRGQSDLSELVGGPSDVDGGLDELNRGLEDESYRRWLAMRDGAPDRARWMRPSARSCTFTPGDDRARRGGAGADRRIRHPGPTPRHRPGRGGGPVLPPAGARVLELQCRGHVLAEAPHHGQVQRVVHVPPVPLHLHQVEIAQHPQMPRDLRPGHSEPVGQIGGGHRLPRDQPAQAHPARVGERETAARGPA